MRPRVVVVGAGPVGLTCATLLARAGIPVVLLEGTAARTRDLRASTWHPPTLDMLDALDLAQPLLERGLVSPTWQVRMHPSGERAVFDLAALQDDTRHPYRLQCEQQVYSELVETRLHALAAATVRRGAQVVGLTQHANRVVVDFVGPDGLESCPAEWVIGADGAKSSVRAAVGLQLEGSTYPETSILATTTFPFEQHLAGLSNVNYCWSPEGTFSLLRLPGQWRVSLHLEADRSADAALAPESLEAELQRIVPSAQRYEIVEARAYRIHQRIVPAYRVGRVFLAGDAAHLNSPTGGMGMNGGLHDAFNLCEKLVRVCGGEDAALLDRYDRERRPVAREQIIAQAHRNRTRMAERDPARRRTTLAELQAIVRDPARARDYLLQTSMIAGLRSAAAA